MCELSVSLCLFHRQLQKSRIVITIPENSDPQESRMLDNDSSTYVSSASYLCFEGMYAWNRAVPENTIANGIKRTLQTSRGTGNSIKV